MQYKNLSIYLGSKCNANCTYCHRDITNDVSLSDQFLQNISNNNQLRKIKFFGGEPLIKFPFIKKFVEIANEKIDDKITPFYSITTNGTLLYISGMMGSRAYVISMNLDGTINYKYEMPGLKTISDYSRE
jgi:uncharacterized protein